MKKILTATILAGAMAATSVWAIPSSGEVNVKRIPGYYTSNGGEFTVTAVDESFSFQTFCLEKNEQVGSNPHYYEINPYDAAVAGGVGGWTTLPNGEQGDPISLGTAYLYSQFRKGTLAGYDYTPGSGREASAGLLQIAIWWLEDEQSLKVPLNNPFLNLLDGIDSNTDWKVDADGAYGVKVFNMYTRGKDGTLVFKQDFLYVPDGGLTLAFLGMGLAGLAGMRRIRK